MLEETIQNEKAFLIYAIIATIFTVSYLFNYIIVNSIDNQHVLSNVFSNISLV